MCRHHRSPLFPYTTLFRSCRRSSADTTSACSVLPVAMMIADGIALAALLVLGPRLWPGVWIGSALANLSRSEEHTSELQSHSDLVCRLLLEKKNKSTGTSN